MKKSIKRVSAIALSSLMAVSAIGGVTASAAETTTPEHEYRTIYFINNKEWNDVCAYMWDAPDMKYDNGEVVVEDMSGQPVVENANFPGQELEPIGTTTVLLGGETEAVERDVYSITVDMSVYDAVVFNSPSTDRQQSSNIYLKGTGSNAFYLDVNNDVTPLKDFNATDIKNDVLESDGTRTIEIDTTNINCVEPTVTFVRTGGSVAGAEKIEKTAEGEYTVTVPQGTFTLMDITVDNSTLSVRVNNEMTSCFIV